MTVHTVRFRMSSVSSGRGMRSACREGGENIWRTFPNVKYIYVMINKSKVFSDCLGSLVEAKRPKATAIR